MHKLKRNQLTTLDQLSLGDRFYKSGDKHKTPWTLVPQERTLKYTTEAVYWGRKDGEKYPTNMKGNIPVVYLRSQGEE